MALDSCCWAASSPGEGTVTGSVNRYWISEACAAPYEKLTGGRKRCGALWSLNSYANVGTNCDSFCAANRALQSKMASVPSADSARLGLGKLASGYCATSSGTTAAGTPSVAAI